MYLWFINDVCFVFRLKKGSVYYWDLFVVGVVNSFLFLFGFLWVYVVLFYLLFYVRVLVDVEERVDRGYVFEM